MLNIKYLNGHLEMALLVRSYRGSRVTNASFHIRNCTCNAGDHPRAVFGYGQQLHGVSRLLGSASPFNFDDAFAIDHQLHDVLTAFRVNDYSFTKGDIANDLLH